MTSIFEETDGTVVICSALVTDSLATSEELVTELNVGVGESGGIWEENVCVDLISVVIWVVLSLVRFASSTAAAFPFELASIKLSPVADPINREVSGDEFEDTRDLLKSSKSSFVSFLIIKILSAAVVLLETLLSVRVSDTTEASFDSLIIGEVSLALSF